MRSNNENLIATSNNSVSPIDLNPANDHILENDATESAIKENLEVVLNKLYKLKNANDVNSINKMESDNKTSDTWPNGTILIAGDSMFNNIDETRLSKIKNIKVNSFGGAKINNMYGHLVPLLRKKPSDLILHIGTNDAVSKTSDQILDEILDLKKHVENVVPDINVIISKLIIRSDNPKANSISGNVNKKLVKLGINLLDHSNISLDDLGRKGLHLNEKGTKRLALNIISFIRKT